MSERRLARSQRSEVFESLFDVPQPSGEIEMLEGCPVVRTYGDKPHELGIFIKALYDGV